MAKPSLVQIVPRIAQRAGRESVARLRLYFVGYVTVKRQGNLMKVWLLTTWMMDSTNFAITEFYEVRLNGVLGSSRTQSTSRLR
jgi:hypothetical protein